MTVSLLQGNCLSILQTLPDCSVQTCVTSPPYFGLRDYGVDGQIGLEPTPDEYVNRLVLIFREVRRVLADDGTLWLNLGDSYANTKVGNTNEAPDKKPRPYFENGTHKMEFKKTVPAGMKAKDLIGIPWLVAFALRADGWYLRSEIIWHKPNPMPESVKDRPTKAHEQIFLLAKSAQYFYDADAVKEPVKAETLRHVEKYGGTLNVEHIDESRNDKKTLDYFGGNGKRNRRDVWTFSEDEFMQFLNWKAEQEQEASDVWRVTTKPYKEAHFATFPPDLIEPCILAGTSAKGECPQCGKAWKRVTERVGANVSNEEKIKEYQEKGIPRTTANLYATKERGHTETIGWQPQCDCGAEPVPQKVLDPFNGSGTTGAVSVKHGRDYVGIELNPAYIELSNKRISGVQMVAP